MSTDTVPANLDHEALRAALEAARKHAIPIRVSVLVGGVERVLTMRGTCIATSPVLMIADPEGYVHGCPLRLVSSVTRAERGRRRLWPHEERPAKAPHGAGKAPR